MPLPNGYVLDQQPEAAMPEVSPPPGYVLDAPQQSVADRARASLAARGLTAEQVKQQAGSGVAPSNTPSSPANKDGALTRFARGAGLPTNMDEVKSMAEHLDPVTAVVHGDMAGLAGPVGIVARDAVKTIAGEAGDQAGQAADAAQHKEYGNYLKHSLGAAVPFVGPPVAEGDVAGGLGRAATLLVPEIAERAGVRLAPKAADPLPITRSIGPGAYDTARGIDIGKTLIESGKPVDLATIKEHPSRGLVDHFESLLDHQNKLAEAKLAGPNGQTQIRASDLKAMAPKEVAEVGSTDARVRKAVNNWYQAAIDKATTPEGGVTIQSLDQIKRQLQGRTSYEKMFGNLNADPLRDATTADYARQLDHIGDEYVPGYKEINDRRAALSHVHKTAILPIADAYATTTGPSTLRGIGQVAGGVASLPFSKGAAAARIARGAVELAGHGGSTVDPMTVAKAINKQVARGQSAGMPGWFNEPIPNSDLPTPPAELQPTLRDRFSAVGSDGPPATPLTGGGADMAAGPDADGRPTVIDLKHGDVASQQQLTGNPADRATRSTTSGQNILDPAMVTLADGRTQVRVADPSRLTIDDLAAEADRRAGERIFQNQQRTAIDADSLRRFKDARAAGGKLTDALRVDNMHSGTTPRIRDFQPGESTVRPNDRPVNDATMNSSNGVIVEPIAKHGYVGDESETAFMPPDTKTGSAVRVPPTSIVDALRGNTVRIPGETTVQLPDSRGSSGPGQLNDTVMNRIPAAATVTPTANEPPAAAASSITNALRPSLSALTDDQLRVEAERLAGLADRAYKNEDWVTGKEYEDSFNKTTDEVNRRLHLAPVSAPNTGANTGTNTSGTYPRRAGTQVEFPLAGDRDENDGMLMHRTDAQGKPLQFPVPVPPSTLLPAHFKNARNVRYGAPLSGDIGNSELGLYGKKFESGPQTQTENNILIARNAAEEPGTWAHEVNHAVFQKDLTPAQKQQFRAKVVSAINAGIADKSVLPTIPKTVIAYANTYPKDHERAFNEVFAELGAQYMLNPTAFRERYPDWYDMFKQFYGGKEYIRQSTDGLLTPGNIDLHARPTVRNADGSISTVLSKSFNIDGKEVLLPTISDDGQHMTDRQAVDLYHRTGKHLGVFSNSNAATEYAQQLHQQQAREYNNTSTGKQQHTLISVLTQPSVAESHASALSLSHPASLDPDVQAAVLAGTAEYVDPRGKVIRIPAPNMLSNPKQ